MIKTSLPKISCLLVTANGRFEYLKRSIQCYIDQTYPHKELVVVNEGPKEYQNLLDRHIQELQRDDIRCVWLNGIYTLGGLRNISVGLADGELLCQWDDDDFSTPQRLSSQFSHLAYHPKSKACYMVDQLQYFFNDNTLYWNDWYAYGSAGGIKKYALIPGTLMCYKNIWYDWKIRYPTTGDYCKAGEDSVLADQIAERKDSITLLSGMGYMHVYSHHGNNQVYSYEHHKSIHKARSHYRNHVLKYKNQICRSLDYFKFANEVKVMCRDGLVFVHRSENV